MDEVTSMLQRMRTLAQQASNGSSSEDRAALQEEVTALIEINRIAKDTTFGGQKLLDGSFSGTLLRSVPTLTGIVVSNL